MLNGLWGGRRSGSAARAAYRWGPNYFLLSTIYQTMIQSFPATATKTLFLLLLALLSAAGTRAQKFAQPAQTLPMGWNSWNKFTCDVNEQKIREMTDAMAANGMKAAGYEYLVIDDCWHGRHDTLGFIWPGTKRFPSGMKALVDFVHAKSLKFGVYSDADNTPVGAAPAAATNTRTPPPTPSRALLP